MPRIALYPGSFDPLTNGHVDVVRHAVGLCDRLIVAIGVHPAKKPLFTIEERLKMARGVSKALFKSAMEPYLPADLVYRPKMGFSCPIDHWLRNDLKELAYDTLVSHNASVRGLFRPARVRRLLDEHCSGTRDHHQQLWALLMLELWFEMWIDPPPPGAGHPAALVETASLRESSAPL